MLETSHHPGPLEAVNGDRRVQDRQRRDPLGHRGGELEPNWAADVVDHQVKAVERERGDRGDAEPPEPRPRVVKVDRTIHEPETREVERNAAKPPIGQLRKHLAVQERRSGHAVHTHNGLALPLLANEAPDGSHLELPPR